MADASSPSSRVQVALLVAGLALVLAVGAVVALAGRAAPHCPDVEFGSDTATAEAARSPLAGVAGTGARLRAAIGLAPEHVAYCDDFADPFVLRVGDRYYAYSTNTQDLNVPVMRTGGLFSSGARHDALPELPSWARPGATWAPAVAPVGDHYVLYYTTTVAATGAQCLSHAVASDPAGPFLDASSAPWICPVRGDAIDASPLVTGTGERYLTWATDGRFSGIVAARLSADGLGLASDPQPLLRATQPWESGVVEGPDLVPTPEGSVLLYSGGDWRTAGYAVGAARCTSPLGPCIRVSDRPLISSVPNAAGPGGAQLFTDAEGRSWLVLHAWVRGRVGYPGGARGLYVTPVSFPGGVPTVG